MSFVEVYVKYVCIVGEFSDVAALCLVDLAVIDAPDIGLKFWGDPFTSIVWDFGVFANCMLYSLSNKARNDLLSAESSCCRAKELTA